MSIAKQIKQLGGETIVYGISGTISRFINILLVPLYTRVFLPDDFGVIAIITSLITLLSIFIVLGLDNSTARWYYDSNDQIRQKNIFSSWFWCQLFVGCIASLLIIILAKPLASVLLADENHAGLIRIASLLVPFWTFSKVVGVWMRVQRKPWLNTAYFTSTSLFTIALIALFVLVFKQGLPGLFYGQILASVVGGIGAVFILRDSIHPVFLSWPVLKEMLGYGLPLIPAALASWATASSDRFILQIFTQTSEVGIYSIAASVAAGIAIITTAFQMAWGPFAFSILHMKESFQIYSKVLSIYAIIGGFIGTSLSLFSPLLLSVFTTPAYYAAASSIPFLVFAYLSIGLTYIFSIGAGIAKKSAPVALSIFIGAATSIILNFILIPVFGRDGAAMSNLAAYSVAAAFMYFSSQKYHRIPYQLKDLIISYFYSGLLILFDRLFLPAGGSWAHLVRLTMCLSFFLLAYWRGLIRWSDIERIWLTSSTFLRSTLQRTR